MIYTTSKAVGSLVSRSGGISRTIEAWRSYFLMRSCLDRYRCSSSIAGFQPFAHYNSVGTLKVLENLPGTVCSNSIVQRRMFLGCGDGEEGGVLCKVYEERRVLGYSPEQLFDVVAAVDLYDGFVPWCQRSKILRQHPDGSFDAELEIGFKFLVESYISHVKLERPSSIKVTA